MHKPLVAVALRSQFSILLIAILCIQSSYSLSILDNNSIYNVNSLGLFYNKFEIKPYVIIPQYYYMQDFKNNVANDYKVEFDNKLQLDSTYGFNNLQYFVQNKLEDLFNNHMLSDNGCNITLQGYFLNIFILY